MQYKVKFKYRRLCSKKPGRSFVIVESDSPSLACKEAKKISKNLYLLETFDFKVCKLQINLKDKETKIVAEDMTLNLGLKPTKKNIIECYKKLNGSL